ncbi:Trafficking protein particle complex subunit BET5 [Friedmanniomyces endolithicus]|nr:Trafficking protein particle complex subunit BET5 [Friedmanniomyces endolithicus]KAK0814138.1 Trafficking protein particle complex subunit BET5 [Friedmanniomyces endolithicus]KAK0911214.1 Trafficking protein particle complex subunit BET5 [Friedmanniomyces endolithicus]
MSVYSFYIFDRHTECIYSKRFTQQPSPPRTTPSTLRNGTTVPPSLRQANKDSDDAKLVFGTVFSLRRMCRQLGGVDDQFLSYRTAEYKLHYLETPTQLRLVLLTSPQVGNMRTVLHQIWATLFVEYVVKSPLAPTEHTGGKGVGNELFEGGLERFMEAVFRPQQQQQQ